MQGARILVVEDEVIIGEHLCSMLKQLGYFPSGPFTNFTDAVEELNTNEFDLILLDIILSGKKDGVELGLFIRKNFKTPIIYLTSHADRSTIDRVKEVQPESYIVKPFNQDEIYSTIELVLHKSLLLKNQTNSTIENDFMMIKDKQAFHKVFYKDILYLENDHIYINVITANQKLMIRSNMTDVLNDLPTYFFQIHRGYVVNEKCISKVTATSVFINQHELPLGKKFKEIVLSKFNIK